MRKSVPATRRTPSPWLRLASGVVPSSVELLQVGAPHADAAVEQREQDVGAAIERRAAARDGAAGQGSAAAGAEQQPKVGCGERPAGRADLQIAGRQGRSRSARSPLPAAVDRRGEVGAGRLDRRKHVCIVAAAPQIDATTAPFVSTTLKSVRGQVRRRRRGSRPRARALGASALKPLASMTFALAPPASHANSMPDSVSDLAADPISWRVRQRETHVARLVQRVAAQAADDHVRTGAAGDHVVTRAARSACWPGRCR